MNHMPSQPVFKAFEAPVIMQDGKPYMRNARGYLVPVESVKPVDLLMDELVRKLQGFAEPLSEQVTRFRRHTFADINSLLALIGQEYGVKLGGKKGNITLLSFDGLRKVQVQNADQVIFGPELQAAKHLVDDCLRSWTADARSELRTIITNAFQVDKEGKLNHAALFALFRHDIDDAGWKRAMDALKDSIRIVGAKTYVRFYKRESVDHAWSAITIDLAVA